MVVDWKQSIVKSSRMLKPCSLASTNVDPAETVWTDLSKHRHQR